MGEKAIFAPSYWFLEFLRVLAGLWGNEAGNEFTSVVSAAVSVDGGDRVPPCEQTLLEKREKEDEERPEFLFSLLLHAHTHTHCIRFFLFSSSLPRPLRQASHIVKASLRTTVVARRCDLRHAHVSLETCLDEKGTAAAETGWSFKKHNQEGKCNVTSEGGPLSPETPKQCKSVC